MKKLILKMLFAIIAIIATKSSFAQAEINTEFSTRMNYVFGQLDKSRIPTGLLLDYAMEFASLANYNGMLTDTNKVNKGLLADIYNTLLTSGIHSSGGGFYHPDYLDSLWQVQRQPGIITLCGLYYNYSRFKDNALSSNLITVNSDRFFDLRSFPSKGRTIVTLFDFNAATLVRQWIRNEVNGKQYNFNTAGLKKGLYVLQVDRDDETRTTKIIIE